MKRAATGDAALWLCAGAAASCLAAIVALLLWLGGAGLSAFWPSPIVEFGTADGRDVLGEIVERRGDVLVVRGSERERIGGTYIRIERNAIVSRS
ncbi:MAG TPA: hypothetical protein VFV97_16285, partial [Rhodanobacteraceae bacterium]|nr:hypothetical protein [Rhodanobacteraceae bacterium]